MEPAPPQTGTISYIVKVNVYPDDKTGKLTAVRTDNGPVMDIVEKLVAEVEQFAANSLQSEITSTQIGEKVMEGLRDMDEVAYVRFASVYRQFTDIPSFMNELNRLIRENKDR